MENTQTPWKPPVMSTEAALDMMMKILPDVALIMNDTEADEMIAQLRSEEAGNVETGDAMRCLLPMFAGKYRENLYNIVAAFAGCTVDEIREQDISKTMLTMMYGLKVTGHFFTCCLRMVRSM